MVSVKIASRYRRYAWLAVVTLAASLALEGVRSPFARADEHGETEKGEETRPDETEPDDETEADGETGPALRFILGEASGRPGEAVAVPFGLQAPRPLSVVAASVEFDPSVLEVIDVRLGTVLETVIANVTASEHSFEWFADNEEGWVQLSLVTDFQGRESLSVPAGLLVSLSEIVFRVRDDVPRGPHPLRFTRPEEAGYPSRLGDETRDEVFNAARPAGRPFGPEDRYEESSEPEYDDGTFYVPIIGDIGIFVLGDANDDLIVDISDPARVLGFLFQGGAELACPRASDTNADGTIDISDPILVLNYLFAGTTTWEPSVVYEADLPEGEDGEDAASIACSL